MPSFESKSDRKLVYVSSGIASVFDSQVLALLNYYNDRNWFKEIILLFGYRNDKEKEWIKSKKINNIKLILFRTYPNYSFFNPLAQNNIARSLAKIAMNFNDTYFFHIRGEILSYNFRKAVSSLNISLANILTDIRGASYEEIHEFFQISPVLKWLKLRNIRHSLISLGKSSQISSVSNGLKSYLYYKWNIPEHNVTINNCLVSNSFNFNQELRTYYRLKLFLNDGDFLIIFTSGGIAKWQENDMILKLADKGFKVLNLSRISFNHTNIINIFVPYKVVPGYLCAADAAFIWRKNSIVNKVSSPVKFSEYVSCGLPIIHNGTVELINQVCNDMSNGILINEIDELSKDKIKRLISIDKRINWSELGYLRFGLPTIAESYNSLYTKITRE